MHTWNPCTLQVLYTHESARQNCPKSNPAKTNHNAIVSTNSTHKQPHNYRIHAHEFLLNQQSQKQHMTNSLPKLQWGMWCSSIQDSTTALNEAVLNGHTEVITILVKAHSKSVKKVPRKFCVFFLPFIYWNALIQQICVKQLLFVATRIELSTLARP